jgi:hypothetical protein
MAFVALLSVSASAAVLHDGDFELLDQWQAYHGSVSVDAAGVGAWWVGGDSTGWAAYGGGVAPQGSTCVGDADGYGASCGLTQYAPVGSDWDRVSIDFDFLLWKGEGSTRVTFGLFGWSEGDTIDLSSAGPGGDAVELLALTTLSSPAYSGDNSPSDDFTHAHYEADLSGGIDYVGVWIQYRLNGGSFYLDDVTMDATLIPEPTTIVIFACSAAAIGIRRRRN